MVFTINEEGYIDSYSLDEGVSFSDKENIVLNITPPSDFYNNFSAYKFINNEFVLDETKVTEIIRNFKIAELRRQREVECFPIINRGQLWYNTLTENQMLELSSWYQSWLDVTETLLIPQFPLWLN